MRKNFTQKFLTIFVFMSVFAFGYKANAQVGDPAPDCSIDNGGTIVAIDTILCRGGNPAFIRGEDGQIAGASEGFGNGGGPRVSYQWMFKNSTTGGVFIPVNSSVMESSLTCGNPARCSGQAPSFDPGPLTEVTDFVRYRYTGTEISPRACFTSSNIVTIYAADREKPLILTCVSSMTYTNTTGTCFRTVTLPGRNYGPVAGRDPNGVVADDNCTGTSTRTGDTLRLYYYINVTGISSNNVVSGTQIANNPSRSYAFPIGRTRVTVVVQDSSMNLDTCGFFVNVNDVDAPVFTGPDDLVRYTETDRCAANITGSEVTPTFFECTPVNRTPTATTITYQIRDSIAPGVSAPSTMVSGANSGTAPVGDRIYPKGTTYIVYTATDAYGNSAIDTLKIRVFDNVAPVITTVPANRNYVTRPADGGCRRTVASLTSESGSPSSAATGSIGGSFGITPTVFENCGAYTTRITGPNDFSRDFNTSGPGWDNTYFNIGRSTLNYVVTDAAGNSSTTATQVITIIDTIDPVVFCPANETRNTSTLTQRGNSCTYDIPGLVGTFNDPNGCQVRYVKYSFSQGGTTYFDTTVLISSGTSYTVAGPFRIGSTIVTSRAYDTTGVSTSTAPFGGNNASQTCTFTVTVNDNTAPVVTCRPFTLQLNNAGTATLTAANIMASSSDCSPLTYTISQSAFTCANMGTNSVLLTATDSYGNSSNCVATVTVVSSIVVTANTTGNTFCSGSTSGLTTTATGGTGAYTYDITSGPSDNNTGATSGTFTGLAAGTYVVRVTDANGCYSTDTAVISSSAKGSTDVSVVATVASGNSSTLTSTNTSARVDVRVSEIGGFNAPNVVVNVFKGSLPSGVTISLPAGVANNSEWTLTESAFFYTLTKSSGTGGTGLNCGQTSTIAVNVARSAGTPAANFAVSFSLGAIAGQSADYEYNDSYSRPFVTR